MTRAEFAEWFAKEGKRLERLDPGKAADEIAVRLAEVDPRLGVEAGDGEHGRELILSAFGDATLFQVVDDLCSELRAPGWTIVALKPPRGFAFTLDAGGASIDASSLLFDPLESPSRSGELGIRLLAGPDTADAVRELASLIVETGVGERAAARIKHLDVAVASAADAGRALKIAELGEYLEWHAGRHASN
jgi:hypothetical protein